MRKPLVACVAFSIVALAAGCGGGGGSSGGITPPTGGGGSAGSASSSVTIAIPPKPTDALSKSPAYVSPNTASIGIVVTPQGGTAYPVVIANVPGSSCVAASGGGYTCTISVTATYGVDTVAITAYSAANLGGSILSSGSITSTFSASASPSPALVAVLTGVVKGIAMSIVHGTTQDGYVPVGQSAVVSVNGLDASGAFIIGTYDGPITAALPANSGLGLGTTSFADSTHNTTTVTWNGAPTYYNAPTSTINITASSSGGAVTGSVKFHPLTSLLSLPAGDGGANAEQSFGLVHSGSSFIVATADQSFDDGEIASFDPATGAQTVSAALGFEPNALYRDSKFGGIWVSDDNEGSGILHCYTSPSSADAPVPVPTAGSSDPDQMVADFSNRLWFTSASNAGYVVLNGTCSTSSTSASFETLPYNTTSPDAVGLAADKSVDNMWAVDASNAQIDQFFNGFSTGSPLPALNPFATGYDGAGNIVIGGLDGATIHGVLQILPQDGTTFSSTYHLYANAGIAAIDAPQTGANAPIATADEYYGGLAIYYPATPALSTFVPVPQPIAGAATPIPNLQRRSAANRRAQFSSTPYSYCAGIAVDGVGMPWGACRVGGRAALERLVLTSDWAAFEDVDDMMQADQAEVGVAGGTAAMTFTVTCSAGLTCTTDSVEPRVFRVTANTMGPKTITVNGSDGRSQIISFTVTQNTT